MAKRRAFIFGHGGHARVIASMIGATHSEISFISREASPETIGEDLFFKDIQKFSKEGDIYLGVGSNKSRIALYEKLKAQGILPATCISDRAFIASDCEIGAGAVICPGAVIMSGAHLGANVIVNTLSSVDHDCKVGDHTQITAGVIFGGTTVVGKNCFFGIRSATVPNITIGDNVMVMAGSLVTKNIDHNLVVGGYPAVSVKRND